MNAPVASPTKPVTPTTASAPKAADPTKPQTIQQISIAPFQIKPLVRSADDKYLKMLVYGIPGAGKTTLLGSAADVQGMDDILMINAESGTLSIEDADWIQNRYYIDQIYVRTFKAVAEVQMFLKAHCAARDANNIPLLKQLQAKAFRYSPDIIDEECEEDEFEQDEDGKVTYTRVRLRKYKTCIIDSLSEINTYLMYQLLGIKEDTKLDDDAAQDTAGWDEYKKGNQMLQLLVRAFRDLPVHLLMVCGTHYVQDHLKVFHWSPTLLGKLGQQIQGFVDICGYLVVDKPKDDSQGDIPRRLYIQPIGKFDAKSRLAGFKMPYIDNPTMGRIMQLFRGHRPAPKPATGKIAPKK